ncbi:hypothetical protein SeLEV6574_g03342 [Synchytrium endobioticum]|nr:hypothetical protein SeLEV6574_g03342 [Synchytrium endobioticum]
MEGNSVVAEDAPAFAKLLAGLQEKAREVMGRTKLLAERLTELPTSEGVSLLQVKVHSYLSYLSHLVLYMLLKANGAKIEGHATIDSLIELRTVLEKIKPIELKLKYQIDKLVKAAITADEGAQSIGNGATSSKDDNDTEAIDPLMYRPNPAALVDDTTDTHDNHDPPSKDPKYKPPRVAPMPYIDTPPSTNKAYKLSQRAKEHAAKSRIIRDLRSQFDDRPEEASTEGTGYARKDTMTEWDHEWNEREKFEEDHFVRLNLTRKDKSQRKQLQKSGGMGRFQDEFENLDRDFDSLSSLNKAVQASEEETFGRGLLGRKNKRVASALFSADAGDADVDGLSNKRMKYKDVNEYVSSTSKQHDRKGRFEKRVRRFVGGGKKGGK